MTPESAHALAGPGLLVRTPDAERSLSAGRSYVVGRDPQSDIFVNDSRVSWRHAVLRQDGATWMFEDVGSTNGTFQGRDRVQRVPIAGSVALRLGHPDDGPAMSVALSGAPAGQVAAPPAAGPATRYADSPPPPNPAVGRVQATPGGMPAVAPAPGGYGGGAPAGYGDPGGYGPPGGVPGGRHGPAVPAPRPSMERMPSQILQLPTRVLKIGRAADNDVVIEDLSVSRYHAELRKDSRSGGYNIVDLGSHNGVFVNGQRVGSAPITERDTIAIGPSSFRLVGDELQLFIDTGDVSFVAQDLTVTLPSGRTLLDHISFPLNERCLLGVIGPSGAGKSTLLGALTGNSPATHGTVFYDGRDLYRDYAELRHRIGLVPQENILHAQLTGRKALGYAAQLRFPRDTSDAERNHRIDEVLGELALTKHADTKVAAMSGGQQKRVNVALELLTKPSLLFLDEPTSGLDPGLDRKLMQQMQELAHNGHTVIVVTHSVASLNLCDRLLVLAAGGRIAYFGAPQDGLKHFGAEDWADVFQNFDDQPGRDWAAEYRNSVYYQQYIVPGMEGTGAVHARDPRSLPAAAPKSSNKISQTMTLIRRYSSVIAADRGFLIALVGVPVLIAGIVKLLAPKYGLTDGPGGNQAATSLLLILALGSCLAGTVNSIRELVKERQIYSRERATGLSAGAYLVSKLVVLSVISAFQSIILVGLALIGDKLPPHGSYLSSPLIELIAAMALVSIASMSLGLLISALVSTSEQSILLLFPIVIVQVIMTGGAVPVDTAGLKEVAWFFPARWGFGSAASTVDLGHITVPPGQPVPPIDPVWIHDAKTWLTDMGLSLALGLFFAIITWWRLNKQGPLKRGAGG